MADPLMKRALEGREAMLGALNPFTLTAVVNFGALLFVQFEEVRTCGSPVAAVNATERNVQRPEHRQRGYVFTRRSAPSPCRCSTIRTRDEGGGGGGGGGVRGVWSH